MADVSDSGDLPAPPQTEAIGARWPARHAPYAVIGLGVALLVGVFMLMVQGDEERVYRQVGHRIQEVKLRQFDAFWDCALGGDGQLGMRSNADLSARLQEVVSAQGQHWASHVNDACFPLLESVPADLSVLIAPEAIKPQLQVMVRSAEKLELEMRELAEQVNEGLGDPALVHRRAAVIARPWYEFLKAHGEITRILKAKRGEGGAGAHSVRRSPLRSVGGA